MSKSQIKISVVGLGYVGLPVATAMATRYPVVGFDVKSSRVAELKKGYDRNKEVTPEELKQNNLSLTDDPAALRSCNFHIIAVPTPVDGANIPDLEPLISSSTTVGKILKKGDIVVYESTVFPGATEEYCLPVLERESGLKSPQDFTIGYSPERINPGDKEHSFTKIKKIVSAQTEASLKTISQVYGSVVEAGIYEAKTIQAAETAKVLENTQRDINIALMNELSLICDRLGIDTLDVLDAAGTKWNFLKFKPGLVGGHCIGVDPYYLTYRAQQFGYHPKVILSGREINDSMGSAVARKTVKLLLQRGKNIANSRVTILGLTFKENIPDQRNSKVFDIIDELLDYKLNVQICDPMIYPDELPEKYRPYLRTLDSLQTAEALIVAVAHQELKDLPLTRYKVLLSDGGIFIDLKGLFDKNKLVEMGWTTWRL